MNRDSQSFLLGLILVACAGPEVHRPDGGVDAHVPLADSGMRDGGEDSGPDIVPLADAGSDASSSCVCDDAVDCTLDRCTPEGCIHEPVHRACGPGLFCGTAGCTTGEPCGSDTDCPTDRDACTAAMRCDPALERCTWSLLDGDDDGFAPLVCGGLDCADATPEVHPGASEICNRLDDDCDGTSDGPVADASCPLGARCVDGACACAVGEELCDGIGCRALSGDPSRCGTCDTACALGALCEEGACRCPAGTDLCGDACVNLDSDSLHCGECDLACGSTRICASAACVCAPGTTECDANCVDTSTDANHCGACDLECMDGASCALADCSSSVEWLRGFQSVNYLTVMGTATHPSGDTTLLVAFATSIDEIPFRGISAGSGVYLTRRSASGEERWFRTFASMELTLVGRPDREDFALVGPLAPGTDLGDGESDYTGELGVAHYDASGTLTSKRTIDSLDPTRPAPRLEAATMHEDGALSLLVALDQLQADFGGGALGAACCLRRAVARYAADGTYLASWELPLPFAGGNSVRGSAIEAGPLGTVVVGGTNAYNAVFGTVRITGNGFIATYSGTGTPTAVFALPFGLFTLLEDWQMALSDDGDVFLTWVGVLLARFAPDGMSRWILPVDPAAPITALPAGLTVDRNGNPLLFGTYTGHFDFGGGAFDSAQGWFMASYDADGSFLAARGIEDDVVGYLRLSALEHATSGAWIVSGTFLERLTIQGRSLEATVRSPFGSSASVFLGAFQP